MVNIQNKNTIQKDQIDDVLIGVFDVIDDVATIQDNKFHILKANKAAQKFFNMEEDELIGKFCYELFSGATTPCPCCPVPRTIQSGQKSEQEIRHNKTGSIYKVSSVLLPGENSEVPLVLHIAKNITTEIDTAEKFRASEAQLTMAFDASSDAIAISREDDGCFVQINQGFTKLSGYTEEEVKGVSSLELGIWCDESVRKKLIASLTEKGDCENLEARFKRKDGKVMIGLLSAQRIMMDSQPHILSITRDISSLKKAEEEIRSQKRIFETMFNALKDGAVITDVNRRIQLVNNAALEMFGFSREDVVGRSTSIFYAEKDLYDDTGRALYSAEAKRSNKSYVTTYRHSSGRVFPGETFGSKLYDEEGGWIGNLGIIHDISDKRKAEDERTRLYTAIEQLNEIIVITDNKARIHYVNPAFERTTGYTAEEVIGRNPKILKSGDQDEKFYSQMWETISGGKTFQGQFINRRKDGTTYTEEATISPVIGADGKVVSYIAIKRDITNRLKLENQLRQAQKMESVGRLTGGVAHDFNNILGVIIGYSELALMDLDPADALYMSLQKILDAGERSAGIVRQLLAFSRQQPIAPKTVYLNQVVEDMLKMLRRLIGENIELSWIPKEPLPPIKIDPTQIDQILANLCVNSKDAITGAGKVSIETGMVEFDELYCALHEGFIVGEFVSLTLRDNGCGIDDTDLQKVFEPFFTTKELGCGTGLGLSTVYGIVKQNGGFINVESEIGKGTTVELFFPPSESNTVYQPRVGTESHSMVQNEMSGETILVVEDDESLLGLTCLMLQQLGYLTLSAQSPKDALLIAKEPQTRIDLFLTDVIMPEMNGRELGLLLKQTFPNLKQLYMSGYAADVIVEDTILKDGIHYLQKPFSKDELAAKVRNMLDE